MLRFVITLALLATAQECNHPAGQIWRASEERGDKPAIGYELRNENGKVAGDAYILDPDFPHDFKHGRRAAMTIVDQSPREITVRVRWNRDLKATFRFQFKDAVWPDSFQAIVTEIDGSETYDPIPFNFAKTK